MVLQFKFGIEGDFNQEFLFQNSGRSYIDERSPIPKIRGSPATVIVALDGSGDTDNINEALDLLPDEGGDIFVKEGTHLAKKQILMNKANTRILGTGSASIIKAMYSETTEIINISASGCSLQSLQLDPNGKTKAIKIAGSIFSTVSDTWIQDLWIIESTQLSIEVTGYVERLKITGCNIQTGTNLGIILGGFGNPVDYCIISNNLIISATKGIESYGDNNLIGHNIIYGNNGNPGWGILVDGDNNIISGNRIENNNIGLDISANADRTCCTGNQLIGNSFLAYRDAGTNTHPNGASGTTNLAFDDLNIIA